MIRLFAKDKVIGANPKDYLTIQDLKKHKNKISSMNIKNRKNVKILFIDDGGFYTEPLSQLGYKDIDVELEFKDISRVEPYDIIFCDINDVAKNIYPVGQGAALASEIKRMYPNKYVIIFSAQNQKPSFAKYYEDVDAVIDKTSDQKVFQDVIDKYISIQNDPIAYWENLEKTMLKQKLNKISISKLEHYYVASILYNKNYLSEIDNNTPDIDFDKIVSFIGLISDTVSIFMTFWGR